MKKILIIEDDINVAKALRFKIGHRKYGVLEARSGVEGLEMLSENPDLIILDLYMPRMDGMEFIERLRKMPEYKDIPIIIQTVSQSQADLIGLVEGVNVVAIMIKSNVTLEMLADEVEKVFEE